MFNGALSRLSIHLRSWILRYCLSFCPALILSLILSMSFWQSFTHPYISHLIEQRNVDILFDALLNIGEGEGSLLLPLIITVLVLLIWVPIQIGFLWLEGGTFFSYISEKPNSWKEFSQASNRWFGFMLLNSSICTLTTGCILVLTLISALVVRLVWSPLMWCVIAAGVLLSICIVLWFEVTRAVAVVHNERHMGRVFLGCLELFRQTPWQLVAIYAFSLCAMVFLLLIQQWVSVIVPVTWWLLSLLLLQALAFTRHGLRLFRYSGVVFLTQNTSDPDPVSTPRTE